MAREARLFGIFVDRQAAFTFPCHYVMAFVAGYVGHLMRTAPPMQGGLLLVALLTDLVLLLRCDGFKGNGGGSFFIEIRFRGVGAHRSVAGFAGFCERLSQCLF